MKFFMAKQTESTNTLEFLDTRIIIAMNSDDALAKYKELFNITDTDKIICKEVKEGSISFTLPVDKFTVKYPNTVKTITIRSVVDDTIISGYLIAKIPAMATLKEEEVLEYLYRGNIERYNKTIQAAQKDEAIRLSLRRLRQAIPFDRLVIDTGAKNMIVPINSNYVIED